MIWLCAFSYGMASVIDRMDLRLSRGFDNLPGESWTIYWLFVVIGGMVGGVAYYYIGMWWYGLRLKWAGVDSASPKFVRGVYLFSVQVLAVPWIVAAGVDTVVHKTPLAAIHSESTWIGMLLLIFPFWAVGVSYVGVRTFFRARKGPAIFWFLVLPGFYYALIFILALTFSFFTPLSLPADVDNPKQHTSNTLSFSYPGNWWIDEKDPEFSPEFNVGVQAVQDAYILITYYGSPYSLSEEIQGTLDLLKLSFEDMDDISSFSDWGKFRGEGRIYEGYLQKRLYVIRIFISAVAENEYIEIREIYEKGVEEKVLPGLEIISSSLQIKPIDE